MSIRPVKLPAGIPGRLYLSGMPGSSEGWESFLAELARLKIGEIVSLTPDGEIEQKSPGYAAAIANEAIPCLRRSFPISDFGVPHDLSEYASFVERIAGRLRAGGSVLVHCGAGIGRTGTFAVCLLIALGEGEPTARQAVISAGSKPETPEQDRLIAWFARSRTGERDSAI